MQDNAGFHYDLERRGGAVHDEMKKSSKWDPIYTLFQNAGNTLGIRQSYAICTVNSLLNCQAYAKRSMQVSDMSAIH